MRYPSPRFLTSAIRSAAAALASLALAGVAHATDVYWSVGVHQPGVSVRIGNTVPVVVMPSPRVVVAPAPVYVAPPAVIVAPPYGVAYGVYGPPGHRHHAHKHRWHHHGGWHAHGWRDDGHRGDRWRDGR
ncbi:hypothetical protein [Tepidimonas taiwanensis]|uniref:hypothetical protein n=1 Tax=Tepidimonas taiwanensis TaxID=307486 RepID=UPI0009DEB37D|nr:hypothetical protein [Tepidimonas taiwanensis]